MNVVQCFSAFLQSQSFPPPAIQIIMLSRIQERGWGGGLLNCKTKSIDLTDKYKEDIERNYALQLKRNYQKKKLRYDGCIWWFQVSFLIPGLMFVNVTSKSPIFATSSQFIISICIRALLSMIFVNGFSAIIFVDWIM